MSEFSDVLDDYVKCRTWGHSWDAIPSPVGLFAQYGDILEVVRCTRCTTLRWSSFSVFTGERLSAIRYDYPSGYSLAGQYSRNLWRKESNARNFFQPVKKKVAK